ncbi:MAG: FtsW/RodA/SpoVE family cell cycle protein [Candidatus Azambacteria bacterium]|nr:FtsW/RodA/SpoVE family cell cycle protein [Candidatus Azambacteria bacterium]
MFISYVRHFIKRLDLTIIIVSFLLVGIGLVSLYGYAANRNDFSDFKKQVIFFAVGIIFMLLLSFVDWRIFKESSALVLTLYFFCLIALTGLFFLAPEIRGVKGWYRLGPLSFDPIEALKLVLIILLAKYFSTRHIEMYRVRHILLSGFYVALPVFLIFLQPNLGPVLIIISLWVGALVISGIKLRHFFILVLCGVLVFIFSWNFLLKDYQKERVVSFIYPIDPLGMNWNQNQAKIAIGSGGILGQGIGKGSQTQYGFLPESQTDFIFSAIAEETGLLGVSVLLALLLLLIWKTIKIALSSYSNFPRLFATGFAILLISEIFIHIGMNLGLLPIIGISLPLVSYGGSGLIVNFIALGILQSIKNNS